MSQKIMAMPSLLKHVKEQSELCGPSPPLVFLPQLIPRVVLAAWENVKYVPGRTNSLMAQLPMRSPSYVRKTKISACNIFMEAMLF